jgi:hypothetical protein
MPIRATHGRPTLFIRRSAFERVGLTRAACDERFGLTSDEFQVEGNLIALGPFSDDSVLQGTLAEFEDVGLRFFEDFFDLSGNWPEWLALYVRTVEELETGANALSSP